MNKFFYNKLLQQLLLLVRPKTIQVHEKSVPRPARSQLHHTPKLKCINVSGIWVGNI